MQQLTENKQTPKYKTESYKTPRRKQDNLHWIQQ